MEKWDWGGWQDKRSWRKGRFSSDSAYSNPKDGIARAWSSIRAATEEVSIMISSAIALRRQIRMGGLQLLKDVSEGHAAKVRLLIPDDADGHISLQ
jgi:hypothetical protein